jgi:hypothetical protein
VEQAHGHRLGVALLHQGGKRLQDRRIQMFDLFAPGTESPRNAQAVLPRNERWWAMTHERVELGPVLATDLDDVLEPGIGHQHDARTAALQQSVGGHRRAVEEHEALPVTEDATSTVQDRLGRVGRGGGDLERPDGTVLQQHQIGEGAACVHREDGAR